MYDLGDPVTLSVETRDASGALANAGAVTLTVTQPDGADVAPAVTNTTTGVYTATLTPTQAGRHTVRWVATGANASAYTDVFEVDAGASAIVSLADAKAHLNFRSNADDEELRFWLDVASAWVEARVGPVGRRVVTQTVTPSSGKLYLAPPVVSITSISAANGYPGGPYSPASYTVGTRTGVVYGAPGIMYPVVVTYVAGWPVVPPQIRAATLMLVKTLWDTQQGGSNPYDQVQGQGDIADLPGMGLALWRVEKLLEPFLLGPVVA